MRELLNGKSEKKNEKLANGRKKMRKKLEMSFVKLMKFKVGEETIE